jgi:hypothetical protein
VTAPAPEPTVEEKQELEKAPEARRGKGHI